MDLTITKVVAATAAAFTAALIASFFGVSGTLTGAAVVAASATIGNAIYSHSLQKTKERVQDASRRSRTPATEPARAAVATSGRRDPPSRPPMLPGPQSGTPAHASDADAGMAIPGLPTAATADELASPGGHAAPDPADDPLTFAWFRSRAPQLIAVAALVFALAIGTVTLVELGIQEPLSSLFGHSSSSGTTVGAVVGGSSTATTTIPPSTTVQVQTQTPSSTTPATTTPATTIAPTTTTPATTGPQQTEPPTTS